MQSIAATVRYRPDSPTWGWVSDTGNYYYNERKNMKYGAPVMMVGIKYTEQREKNDESSALRIANRTVLLHCVGKI